MKPASKNWATKPLTNTQKAALAIAARAAFDLQNKLGLTGDLNLADWRHEECKTACGLSSFRELTNTNFRSVMARFLALAGKPDEAKKMWAKTGRVQGSDEHADTHENREVAKAILRDLIASSQGRISDAYVAKIIRDKHPENTLENLPASALQKLIFTIQNRLKK